MATRAQKSRSDDAAIAGGACVVQPSEMDWWRIKRSLAKRLRYRYVSPAVLREDGGFRIVSPCCSRKVDPAGGPIDIARLAFDRENQTWRLHSMNHVTRQWELQSQGRLHELLALLMQDPQRVFWQ